MDGEGGRAGVEEELVTPQVAPAVSVPSEAAAGQSPDAAGGVLMSSIPAASGMESVMTDVGADMPQQAAAVEKVEEEVQGQQVTVMPETPAHQKEAQQEQAVVSGEHTVPSAVAASQLAQALEASAAFATAGEADAAGPDVELVGTVVRMDSERAAGVSGLVQGYDSDEEASSSGASSEGEDSSEEADEEAETDSSYVSEESSSDASSNSDDEEMVSPRKALDTMLGGDSDDEPSSQGPPRTAHEIVDLPLVVPIDVEITPQHKLLPVGSVAAVVGTSIVVEGSGRCRALDEGTVFCLSGSRTPLGVTSW
eukprot:jgi/Chlat1/8515/Chrsp80S07897